MTGGGGLVSVEIEIYIYISIYVSLYIVDLYIYIFMHLSGRQRGGRTFVFAAPGPMCVCVRARVCMPELAYQLRSEHHSYNLIVVGKQPTTRTLGAYFYMHDHTYPHTQTHTQANSTVRATQNRSNKLHSAGSDKQGGLGHMNQHNSKSFTLRT